MNEVIEKVRAMGADVETGLKRCAGKEALYTMLIGTALKDKNFETLRERSDAGDVEGAFGAAHALKGVLGNLCLSPLTEKVEEVTEVLRAKNLPDTAALDEIAKLREEYLKAI